MLQQFPWTRTITKHWRSRALVLCSAGSQLHTLPEAPDSNSCRVVQRMAGVFCFCFFFFWLGGLVLVLFQTFMVWKLHYLKGNESFPTARMKTEGWNLIVSPPQTKVLFSSKSQMFSYGKLIWILPSTRKAVTLLPGFVWQGMIHVHPVFSTGG